MSLLHWDIFCRVIDNWGDIGVSWRLAADLAVRGHTVYLWTDDASALAWMAPQGAANVHIHPWPTAASIPLPTNGMGHVVLETFGCDIPLQWVVALAHQRLPSLWLNLEYLSAEAYVERCHGLPSPITTGHGAGLTRWFYYPGFTPRTGGLLREPDLLQRHAALNRQSWRAQRGITANTLAVSLFCYESEALPLLLEQLRTHSQAHLLVTPGRAAAAIGKLANHPPLTWLPPCPQVAFDEMLWACDLNIVRGEDSLVRALWAGQPFIWHIYPQHDRAHHAKLHAFLDWLQAPSTLRHWHLHWNGLESSGALPVPDAALLRQWQSCVQAARARLLAQDDLTGQLLDFVKKRQEASSLHQLLP